MIIPPQYGVPIKIGLTLVALGGLWIHGYSNGRSAVSKQWEAARVKEAVESGRIMASAVDRANIVAGEAADLKYKIQEVSNENGKIIDSLHDSNQHLIDELNAARLHASPGKGCPDAVPDHSPATGGGNRPDSASAGIVFQRIGLVAARFAKRADQLSEQVRACQAWTASVGALINDDIQKAKHGAGEGNP